MIAIYAYIRGKLTYKDEAHLVLETGGVGYEILAGTRVLSTLPSLGEEVVLFTYFHVREDAQQLFGFLSQRDKAMFERLIAVNGVGPKVGMSILSVLSVEELSVALATSDARMLSRVPGVGRKTADRLMLELRDKIDNDELLQSVTSADQGAGTASGSMQHEAVQALMSLGYSSIEARRAVDRVAGATDVESLILAALKNLGT